jgi:hypothetical protein
MGIRKIELDEDANQILESFLDDLESSQGADLSKQKERAERGFREGRFTSWQEVKRQNGLVI